MTSHRARSRTGSRGTPEDNQQSPSQECTWATASGYEHQSTLQQAWAWQRTCHASDERELEKYVGNGTKSCLPLLYLGDVETAGEEIGGHQDLWGMWVWVWVDGGCIGERTERAGGGAQTERAGGGAQTPAPLTATVRVKCVRCRRRRQLH